MNTRAVDNHSQVLGVLFAPRESSWAYFSWMMLIQLDG
jgi:hypothetical protein